MSSKIYETFIDVYKALEAELRLKNMSVREFEDTLSEEGSKKLQLIRLNRNFIQHQNDYQEFVSVNNTQIAFMNSLTKSLQLSEGVAKDAMISIAKYGSICFKSKVSEAIEELDKKGHRIIVLDDDQCFYSFIDSKDVIHILNSQGKMNDKLMKWIKASKFRSVVMNEPVRNINTDEDMIVVNTKDKVLGIILKEE